MEPAQRKLRGWRRRMAWIAGVVILGAGASILSAWIPVGVKVWRQHAQEQHGTQISKPPGSARPRILVRWSGLGYERCLINTPTEFADAAEADSPPIPIEWPSFLPVPRDDQ